MSISQPGLDVKGLRAPCDFVQNGSRKSLPTMRLVIVLYTSANSKLDEQ